MKSNKLSFVDETINHFKLHESNKINMFNEKASMCNVNNDTMEIIL